MKPVHDEDGYIINANVLSVDAVVGRKVRCPMCQSTFETWPQGWDAHADHRCAGLENLDSVARKAEFKATSRHLFR